MDRDQSVRQLPAGKLQNLKKMFEQDKESTNERPTPPARPPMPSNRIRSPARPLPRLPQSSNSRTNIKDAPDTGQKATPTTTKDVPPHSHRGLSPTVNRRITALTGGSSDKDSNKSSNISNNASTSSLVTKKIEHRNRQGNGDMEEETNFVTKDNPLYSGSVPQPDVRDMYSKVLKKRNKIDETTKHTSIFNEPNDLQRREAIRLTKEEKRRTVATLDFSGEGVGSSGVSVAARTKMFDQPKTDKPTPPKKPEAIRRQPSLRTAVELNEKKNAEKSSQENVYSEPWESSSILEKFKNQQPSHALRPFSALDPIPGGKIPLDQKPSLPLMPPSVKSDNTRLASPAKIASKAADPPAKSRPGPPPKPPRTHAHDEYLKGKQQEVAKPKANFPAQDKSNNGSNETSQSETISVRERISQMLNQTQDSMPNTTTDLNSTKCEGSNVTLRHQPPSRPPPPRRRPNSGGHAPSLKARPFSQLMNSNEGPCIIDVSTGRRPIILRQISSHGIRGTRNPNDELPPAPDSGKPLGRYSLRRSFSSECIHGSQASSLNVREDDADQWSNMAQYNHLSEYQAVIDPDGYAVPNEFLKLPSAKEGVDLSFYGVGESPHKFLTRIDGFGASPGPGPAPFIPDGSPGFGANTAMRDQTLEKVNKKKMLMVKQKINQVYADLDIIIRGSNQIMEEEEIEGIRESVVDQAELKRRIDYCSSIRQKTHKSIKKSKEYLSAIYPQLFEYCLVVGLRPITDSTGYAPYIIHKFPENRSYKLGSQGEIFMPKNEVSSNLSVPSFCFPDASIFKPGSVTSLSESYSFVMTSADGTRVYGYCRRIQPSDASLPEVICIISPIDAFNMYNTLLNEIETRRRQSLDLASEVIAASFGRPLPKPGKTCHIRTLDDQGEMETIFLTRPSDSRLCDVNYESPLISLGTDKLVKVFSSMLMERRIILCSSNLSILTQTVHALCALLYPFQWQHVYVPLLPMEMLDVVCAPMPFIVGVLSAFLPQVLKMDMEEVLIIDLDKKTIVRSMGDEATILPKKIQRVLKTAINMCKIDSEARNAQWLMVAESFLRMFIEVIGHFGNHVCTQQDGNRIFQKEGFIIEVVSKEVRQFLEWFTETQMFEVFIVNHVEKSDWGSCDLFMQRLQDFKETKEETRRHRGLGAKVKNFGKAIKTKLAAT